MCIRDSPLSLPPSLPHRDRLTVTVTRDRPTPPGGVIRALISCSGCGSRSDHSFVQAPSMNDAVPVSSSPT
eukprot:1732153-Rhodomonas_salina.1